MEKQKLLLKVINKNNQAVDVCILPDFIIDKHHRIIIIFKINYFHYNIVVTKNLLWHSALYSILLHI